MKYAYKFYWDYGRSGSLDGLFVASEQEVQNAIGSDVYFGEVLGKHSEVYGTLQEGDITKLDISAESVAEVSKYLGDSWSGFNPLHYIQTVCEQCEEENSADEWACIYRDEYDEILCEDCYEERKSEI